jgi:hypothetical protein
MPTTVADAGVPEWTQVQQKGGLDPLGMQASSVRLYQTLVPGISNVTLRMRYYGFYAWLSRNYAQTLHDGDSERWKQVVRRSEALYALIAARAGETGDAEAGVAGVLWAQRKLAGRGQSSTVDFSVDSDPGGTGKPYLKQAWGAYGAAYESQLREMGILGYVDGHDISVPTPASGDLFADAFEKSAGEFGPKFLKAAASGRASVGLLDALNVLLPSAIKASSSERRLYEQTLFAESADANEKDIARRRTLILVLRTAERLEAAPHPTDIRWMLYAGADWDGAAFAQREAPLIGQAQRWRAYHASDLWRIAYEALLKWSLDTLEDYPDGLTVQQLVGAAVDGLDIREAGWPKTWRLLCSSLPFAANALSEEEATAEYRLAEEALEAGVGQERAPLRSAQAAVELLAILCSRCLPDRDLLSLELGGHHPDAPSRSIANELTFLETRSDRPLSDLLRDIIKERILDRHLWVAMRKLQFQRDYTFLVDVNDGRMRLRAKDGPVYTNPRLGPSLTFLHDTHLLDENGLTKKGEARAAAA